MREVIAQVKGIVPHTKGDDLNLLSSLTEVLHELAVVNIPTGDISQVAVNNQTEPHWKSRRYRPQAFAVSHTLTVSAATFGALRRSDRS